MNSPADGRPRTRLTLRNLDFAQKCLVTAILAAVGFGYLGALANLFAQHAPADGKASLTLDDFPKIYREQGAFALLREVQNSLGLEDVIKTYHGAGAGVTRMETALLGVMRPILMEEYGDAKVVDDISKPIILWSKLSPELRKKAYDEGVPTDADGNADIEKFKQLFGENPAAKLPEGVELSPALSDSLRDNCVSCHSASGKAKHLPMESYEAIDAYCQEDRGMSYKQLAMTTHVHLLGFSVLFAMTGFLFSLTSYPTALRAVFAPWTLLLQVIEIACWWLAKGNVLFAYGIFYLGPAIGIGLAVQIFGSFFDVVRRRQGEV